MNEATPETTTTLHDGTKLKLIKGSEVRPGQTRYWAYADGHIKPRFLSHLHLSGDYEKDSPREAEGIYEGAWVEALPAPKVEGFTIKDSGKRAELAGGMVRDTTEGKEDFSLVLDGPMFWRWATHLTKGAIKYAKRNWMKCADEKDPAKRAETQDRFKESALRHFLQWYRGAVDEDHAAATFFNINGYEFLKAAP